METKTGDLSERLLALASSRIAADGAIELLAADGTKLATMVLGAGVRVASSKPTPPAAAVGMATARDSLAAKVVACSTRRSGEWLELVDVNGKVFGRIATK